MGRAESTEANAEWEARRDEAVADLDVLIDAVNDALENMRAYQVVVDKNRAHLKSGGRVDETPQMFDIKAVRAALTERLDRLERARSASRLALWRLQLAEGTKIAEIARFWGFSRQLVSRALSSQPSPTDDDAMNP